MVKVPSNLVQCTSSHEGGTQTHTHRLHSGEGSRQQVCEVHQAHEQLLHPAPPILRRLLSGYLLHSPLEEFCVYFCCIYTFLNYNCCVVGDYSERIHTSMD